MHFVPVDDLRRRLFAACGARTHAADRGKQFGAKPLHAFILTAFKLLAHFGKLFVVLLFDRLRTRFHGFDKLLLQLVVPDLIVFVNRAVLLRYVTQFGKERLYPLLERIDERLVCRHLLRGIILQLLAHRLLNVVDRLANLTYTACNALINPLQNDGIGVVIILCHKNLVISVFSILNNHGNKNIPSLPYSILH